MNKKSVLVTLTGAILISMPVFTFVQAAAPSTDVTKAVAQTNDDKDLTPSPTPQKDAQTSEIEDLKKKVESKVSELKNTNKKTLAGYIANIKDKKITIQSDTGSFEIDSDQDVTTVYKISGSSTSEVELDTLKKGDYILVNGPEIGKSVTANAIYLDEHYISKSGKIIEVNNDNYYIKVSTLEKDTYTLDIEKATTTQMLNIKTLKLESVGFSKLKEGDNIHFTAKKGSDKDETRYSAIKNIIIPQEYFNK